MNRSNRFMSLVILSFMMTGFLFAATWNPESAKPQAPRSNYTSQSDLMVDMMPNYQAFWMSFKNRETGPALQALKYLSEQSRLVGAFPSTNETRASADFRAKAMRLQRETVELVNRFASLDRSSAAGKVLSIYKACQDCHAIYATAETKKRREYYPVQ